MPPRRRTSAPSSGYVLPLLVAMGTVLTGALTIASLLATGETVFAGSSGPHGFDRFVSRSAIEDGVRERLKRYERASLAGRITAARAALVEARRGLLHLLTRAPTQANQWALLAEVESRLSGVNQRTKAYLEMARITGPLEFPVIEKRIALGIRVWPLLDQATQAHIRTDIRTLLRLKPNHRAVAYLADVARSHSNFRAGIVRSAVHRWAPARIKAFDHWVKNGSPFHAAGQG